jgi:hypothetical protein
MVPGFDFARRGRPWLLGAASSRGARGVALLLLLVAGLALASVAWHCIELERQLQARQHAVRQARAAQAPAPAVRPDAGPTLSDAERKRINRAIRQLNTPWPLLLGVLEQAASPEVALLSIEPDIDRGIVRVQAEGSTLDALLAHAEKVQQSPQVAHTQLLKIDHDMPGRGVAAPRLSFDVVLAR